jgi:glucose/arabinose dehydrogenase
MSAKKFARSWGVPACVLGIAVVVTVPVGCSDTGSSPGAAAPGGQSTGISGSAPSGGTAVSTAGTNAVGGSQATGGAGAATGGSAAVAGSGGAAPTGGAAVGGSGGAAVAGGSPGGSGGSGGSGGGSVAAFVPCDSMPAATIPALKRGPMINGFTGMMTAGQIIGVPGEANTLYVIGHRDGNVFIVQDGKAAGTLTKVDVANGGNNEQGLLSIAFHPQFATNHLFYLYYTAAGAGDITIDEFERLTPTTAMKKRNIYSQPRAGGGMFHNGGFITFNPKDAMPYMYFSVGNNESNDAGNPDGVAGRVHRIDVESKAHTTFAYGLRNPYRMSIDRLTGDMYIADVANGPGGTIIFNPFGKMGTDYGYRNNNGNPDINEGILRDSNGAAIIGGFVYRGNKIPGLCGRYFYGNHEGGIVHSVVVQDGKKVGDSATHGSLSVPGNITSFGEDGEGELYMASMSNAIYKIVAGP